ncbi:MAG: S41 family peptidase [Brevinematia bacterium]
MNFFKRHSLLITFFAGILIGIALIEANKTFLAKNFLYSQTAESSETLTNLTDDNYYKYYPVFSEAYKIIKREFIDGTKTTAKRLFYGAVKGMLESLEDPYTTFMDPTTSKEFTMEMSGSFGGLGIQIDIRNGWLTVISPMEDTPAWKAGIKPGDKIIEIEGVSTKGITPREAVEKLRGKPGTKVTITIEREGISTPFSVTMIREEIKLKTVKSDFIKTKDKTYGYVKLLEFTQPTAEDFKSQLSSLLNRKIDGLIVDLRNNPGGLITSVANIVDYFQDEGLIVYTKGRTLENNTEFYASKDTTIVPMDLPVVILVNQGSASASEIFTGALKDTGRAVVVGKTTFGKGSVQKTYVFPTDGSLIKYTVAKYYTPSGKCIDKEGIKPDIEEEMWYDQLKDEEKKEMISLQNTNIISEFLKKNKEINEEKIRELQSYLEQNGYKLNKKSVQYLVWMKKIENILPPVYNLEFDNQLEKSIEVLENYKKYKKNYKVYKNP